MKTWKVVVVWFLFVAHASAAWAADAGQADRDLSQTKTKLEIDKLAEEVRELRATSLAIGRSTKLWTAWLAAGGGAATTLLVAVAGLLLNRTQGRRLKQEAEFAREKHFLELFRSLGDSSARVRLGAMGVLIERIARLHREGDHKRQQRRLARAEDLPTLVGVLLNATKREEDEVLQKYVADGLAKALGAIQAKDPAQEGASPLAAYDFQGAKLTNAWWARVDAREVDFYKAVLVRAGMKNAFLDRAILKFADLTKAVLMGARLEKANLAGATLAEADLSEANLKKANLGGADLKGAKLDGAKLDGTRFEGAIIDAGTTFKGANVKAAIGLVLDPTKDEVLGTSAVTTS